MRRSFAAALLGIGLGALPSARAGAVACTPDPVPAATLLLPYFDLDARDLAKEKPKRETTLLWITNANASAVLARVTLWTDLSVPTLAFDLALTGYDVEEVDLWRVFQGTLPGDKAIRCDDGVQTTRQLPSEEVEALRLAHAGQPVPANGGLCSGADHGDTLLRGYVTVDVSGGCFGIAAVFPSDPGYFGPGGIATNDNVLMGQYFVQSRKQKIAESGRLVAIEAAPLLLGSGDASFYGRYVGYSGTDAREPLPTSWGLRYLNDPAKKRTTELLVWRSSEASQGPFACESLGQAGWYPLSQESIVAFDDQENALEITEPSFSRGDPASVDWRGRAPADGAERLAVPGPQSPRQHRAPESRDGARPAGRALRAGARRGDLPGFGGLPVGAATGHSDSVVARRCAGRARRGPARRAGRRRGGPPRRVLRTRTRTRTRASGCRGCGCASRCARRAGAPPRRSRWPPSRTWPGRRRRPRPA